MSVILVVYCKSCVCYFATSCVPSLSPSQCTVAALSYDFTNEVKLTDEVSTVKFVVIIIVSHSHSLLLFA